MYRVIHGPGNGEEGRFSSGPMLKKPNSILEIHSEDCVIRAVS